MWADNVRDRYWWIKIRNQVEELLCELGKAEDDEQTDLYLLRLHLDNEPELQFFTVDERNKVEKLLSILIQDTLKHRNLLSKLTEQIEKERPSDARETA